MKLSSRRVLRRHGTRSLSLARRSLVHTLSFPAQQHKLGAGEAVDPATGRGEDIVDIDDARGLLWLRRGPKFKDEPLPRALIPGGPWDTRAQRAALRRLAEEVRAPTDRYRALRDVVTRALPRARLDAGSLEASASLDESCLFVQGPPGSGKTWTGSQIAAHLLKLGRRVGVVAPTHQAIHNLLEEIEAAATPVRALKKCSPGDPETKYEGAWIENEDELAPFLDPEVRLLAGTAWLFAREELDGQLDVLVIDEAGQMSLADALAVGTAAHNIVLLGDPLQLAQVSQGVHPGGTGCSVLEHLLGDDATVPPDRGLFLERTRRMHPDVCRFVSEVIYDGACSRSRALSGNGSTASARASGTSRSSTTATRRRLPKRQMRSRRSSNSSSGASTPPRTARRGRSATRT